MPLDKIRHFENRNPIVSICVYEKDRKNNNPEPLYISKFINQRKHHVNLLLLEEEDICGNLKSHYCLIKNYNAFCKSEKHNNSYQFCQLCQYKTKSKDVMKHHLSMCQDHKPAHTTLPKEGKNILEFRHIERTQRHPWLAYFDYEAFLKKESKSKSKHIESGVGYYYNGEYKSYTAKKIIKVHQDS